MLSLQCVADFCLCSSSVALPLVTRELPVASHMMEPVLESFDEAGVLSSMWCTLSLSL